MTAIFTHPDGRREVIGDDSGAAAPDPLAALQAEVARLEAVLAKIAEQAGLSKAAAEALAKSSPPALKR